MNLNQFECPVYEAILRARTSDGGVEVRGSDKQMRGVMGYAAYESFSRRYGNLQQVGQVALMHILVEVVWDVGFGDG